MLTLQEPFSVQESMNKLRESFNLLSTTTRQVSSEATTAALFLREQLQDTTFRFFSVIDSVNDLIIIKDPQGRWKTVNKFAQKLYGLVKDDFYTKTDLELAEQFSHLAEGLLCCSKTDSKAWESKSFHRSTVEFEIDGELRSFDMVKTPVFDANGTPKELLVIGRDITALRKGQQKVKALYRALNTASDVIMIMDDLQNTIFCNDAFLATFGYADRSQEEVSRLKLLDSEYVPKILRDEIWSTVRSNSTWTGCIKYRHADGHLVRCPLTIVPVMNSRPEPIFYICTLKTKI